MLPSQMDCDMHHGHQTTHKSPPAPNSHTCIVHSFTYCVPMPALLFFIYAYTTHRGGDFVRCRFAFTVWCFFLCYELREALCGCAHT